MKKIGLLFPFLLAPLLINCGGKGPEPTPAVTYNVITNFNNCSSTDAPTKIKENESLIFHVKADEDYALPESIDVTGCECTYTKEAQSITISNPTSDVSVTVDAQQVIFTYSITTTLENCSSTDVPEKIKTGQSITFTVTPTTEDYVITDKSIQITGCDYEFKSENNKITIKNASSDVTIVIKAEKIAKSKINYRQVEHCTLTGAPETIKTGESITFHIKCDDGFYLQYITPYYIECDFTERKKEEDITIKNPSEDNVSLWFFIKEITARSVVKEAVNCTINGPDTVEMFATTEFTITPDDHYLLPDNVLVTGVEDYEYDKANRTIKIINPYFEPVNIKVSCSIERFTIHFNNCDGSELYTTNVDYGATPVYEGPTPTYDSGDPLETYDFTGWDREIVAATEDTTYTAQYTMTETDVYLKFYIPADRYPTIRIKGTSSKGGRIIWNDNGDITSHTFTSGDFSEEKMAPLKHFDRVFYVKVLCDDFNNVEAHCTFGNETLAADLYLGESVTTIPYRAYYEINVKTAIIKGNLETIGKEAFSNSTELTSITLPNTVTSIGIAAFSDCSNLTTINIPDSLTVIPNLVFQNCTSLTHYTCTKNSKLKEIGSDAFDNCTSLKQAFIPAKLETIALGASAAFNNCTALENIIVDETNTTFTTKVNGQECDALIRKSDNALIFGASNSVIHEGITSIGENAFYGMSIKEVTIPSTVTNIHATAFDACSDIKSIIVNENNLTYKSKDSTGQECNCIIVGGNTVFKGCYETIPSEDFTNIAYHAFYRNDRLESITIPASVININTEAFARCSNLKQVTFAPNSKLESLGQDAFQGCGIESITIPKSLKTLSDGYAFNQCIKLSTVIFEEGSTLDNIGACTFWGCAIEHIDLPSTLKVIGTEAFARCKLTSIKIPGSVTEIKSKAFANCASLTKVDLTEFTDPTNIPTAADNLPPFYECPAELKYYVANQDMLDAFVAKGGGWPADANKYVIGAPSI